MLEKVVLLLHLSKITELKKGLNFFKTQLFLLNLFIYSHLTLAVQCLLAELQYIGWGRKRVFQDLCIAPHHNSYA